MPTFAYKIKVTRSGMHSHDYKKGRKVFEGDYASGEVCAKDEYCAEREVRSNFNKDLGGSTDYKIKLTKISDEPRWSEDGIVSGKDKPTSRSYHSNPSDEAAAGAAALVIPIVAVVAAGWLTWQGLKLGYKGVKYVAKKAKERNEEFQKVNGHRRPSAIKALIPRKKTKAELIREKRIREESAEELKQFLIYFGITFSGGFAVIMMVFTFLKISHVI